MTEKEKTFEKHVLKGMQFLRQKCRYNIIFVACNLYKLNFEEA